MTTGRVRSLFLALPLLLATPAGAQSPPPPELAAAVEKLTSSVNRLVALLEKQAASVQEEKQDRRVQVAAAVLGLRVRRVDGIEEEIRDAERREERVREEIGMLQADIADIEERGKTEDGELSEDGKRDVRETEGRIQVLEQSAAKAGDRKLVLQNELSVEQRRLVGLEQILSGWLEKLE